MDTVYCSPHEVNFPQLDLEYLPRNVLVKSGYKYASTDLRFTGTVYNDPRHTAGFARCTLRVKSKLMARYHRAIVKFYRVGPTTEAGRVSIDMVVMGVRDRVKKHFKTTRGMEKLLQSTLRKCSIRLVTSALVDHFTFNFKTCGMRGRALSVVKKGWGRFYIREEDPFWNELVKHVTGIVVAV